MYKMWCTQQARYPFVDNAAAAAAAAADDDDDDDDANDDVLACMNEETVNGDACLSNNGPGSVPPRNPSQGPTPQQPNFPTSQAQVTYILLSVY